MSQVQACVLFFKDTEKMDEIQVLKQLEEEKKRLPAETTQQIMQQLNVAQQFKAAQIQLDGGLKRAAPPARLGATAEMIVVLTSRPERAGNKMTLHLPICQ